MRVAWAIEVALNMVKACGPEKDLKLGLTGCADEECEGVVEMELGSQPPLPTAPPLSHWCQSLS